MQRIIAIALVGLASCASVGQDKPPRNEAGNLNTAARPNRATFYLGQRSLDDDDWSPVEDQGTFGLEFSHRVNVVGWEVGFMGSRDSGRSGGTKFDGKMNELYGGLRVGFGDNVVRPYVGVGVSLFTSELKASGSNTDDDTGVGAYAHGGVTVDLNPSVYVGLDLRALLGPELSVSGFDRDTDYRQIALVFGFAF
ncbi:MAG: outer membrane beta-barrel protein [Planctomycetes bacterium]|nr:outer membrane beta-barrel protein [Planctomycetota bacterium]